LVAEEDSVFNHVDLIWLIKRNIKRK